MSLRQLKWTTIIAPLVFLALVDLTRRRLPSELLQSWVGDVLVVGVVLFGVLLFSETVFGRIERMQARLESQYRELLALHGAGLDVAGELGLDLVLGYVQEALSNVRKHAEAKHVEVRITAADREVETVIADDGRGFDTSRIRSGPDRTPHFGLSTIRERAESVGGTLQIVSSLGGGTRVEVRLPPGRRVPSTAGAAVVLTRRQEPDNPLDCRVRSGSNRQSARLDHGS
jgi:sensor histidine kinase YesM